MSNIIREVVVFLHQTYAVHTRAAHLNFIFL